MDVNLFGEPYAEGLKKTKSVDEKKKRRWERGFQKWSDEQAAEGYTHYGSCGFGAICDYCKDNSYGRPCVRALNEMLREKRRSIDYDKTPFHVAFDGADMREGGKECMTN